MWTTMGVWHTMQGKPKGRWAHCHQKARERGIIVITLQLSTLMAYFTWQHPSKGLTYCSCFNNCWTSQPRSQFNQTISRQWKNSEVYCSARSVTLERSSKDPRNVTVGVKLDCASKRQPATTGNTELYHLSQLLTDPHTELLKGFLGNVYIHAVLYTASQ